MNRKNVVLLSLAICLVSLILLGYLASTKIGEGGIEEKFLSAVGLRAQEEGEQSGLFGFVLEGDNPLLYIALTLVTLAIGILGYKFSKIKKRHDAIA